MAFSNRHWMALFLAGVLPQTVSSFSAQSARKHISMINPLPHSGSQSLHTFQHSVLFAVEEEEKADKEEGNSAIEEELENLQNQLALIEALEERNKSQLDSFVDEQDQWDSLEEEERQLLLQKIPLHNEWSSSQKSWFNFGWGQNRRKDDKTRILNNAI